MNLHEIAPETLGPVYWVGPDRPCIVPGCEWATQVAGHHDCARRAMQAREIDDVWYCECQTCQPWRDHNPGQVHYFLSPNGAMICPDCLASRCPQP